MRHVALEEPNSLRSEFRGSFSEPGIGARRGEDDDLAQAKAHEAAGEIQEVPAHAPCSTLYDMHHKDA
jgi:hypothetical protein